MLCSVFQVGGNYACRKEFYCLSFMRKWEGPCGSWRTESLWSTSYKLNKSHAMHDILRGSTLFLHTKSSFCNYCKGYFIIIILHVYKVVKLLSVCIIICLNQWRKCKWWSRKNARRKWRWLIYRRQYHEVCWGLVTTSTTSGTTGTTTSSSKINSWTVDTSVNCGSRLIMNIRIRASPSSDGVIIQKSWRIRRYSEWNWWRRCPARRA